MEDDAASAGQAHAEACKLEKQRRTVVLVVLVVELVARVLIMAARGPKREPARPYARQQLRMRARRCRRLMRRPCWVMSVDPRSVHANMAPQRHATQWPEQTRKHAVRKPTPMCILQAQCHQGRRELVLETRRTHDGLS